jgi:bifunctional ADP-heptose synthase (sugar kinase/adenylyltransferase)
MTKREKIIVTCSEFDPFTAKDLKFLQKCKSKGDWLIVGIHTDWWLKWCRGGMNENYHSRREIVGSVKFVDEILSFSDMDGTVCQLLKIVKICYPDALITYVSNTDMQNMPETKIKGIKFETME